MLRKKNFAIVISFLMLAIFISSSSVNAGLDSATYTKIYNPTNTIPTTSNGYISGDIIDRAGNPVDSAFIFAFTTERLIPYMTSTGFGEAGHYFLSVPAGNYFIIALRPDLGFGLAGPTSVISGQQRYIDLSLGLIPGGDSTDAEGFIQGTITNSYGSPISGANYLAFRFDMQDFEMGKTDANGEFSAQVKTGRYGVLAFKSGMGAAIAYPVYVLETPPNHVTNVDLSLKSSSSAISNPVTTVIASRSLL